MHEHLKGFLAHLKRGGYPSLGTLTEVKCKKEMQAPLAQAALELAIILCH